MGKLRTGEQADRVLRFIHGLRSPRIGAQLVRYGFGQADLDRGWELLKKSIGERLQVSPKQATDPQAIERLDAWENRWFPVAQATLAYEHPAVEEKVFLNLRQTTGVEVIISVGTFIERVDALANGNDDDKAAHALLVLRGLNDTTLGEARNLLQELSVVEPLPLPDPEETKRAQAEADAELWGWYKQWSAIARVAITRGDYLRQLGFGSSPTSPATPPEPPTPVVPVEPVPIEA